MRSVLLVVLVACGGSGPKAAAVPANTTPPAPSPGPAPAVAENDASICAARESEFGPMLLDAEHAARRRGRGVTKFSAASSTKAKPLEVCGVDQEHMWLMTATCDDGSRPYQDRMQVAGSRSGNVGAGGTCGAIIDLYRVPCPEKTYEIYLDMYHCGPGETM